MAIFTYIGGSLLNVSPMVKHFVMNKAPTLLGMWFSISMNNLPKFNGLKLRLSSLAEALRLMGMQRDILADKKSNRHQGSVTQLAFSDTYY